MKSVLNSIRRWHARSPEPTGPGIGPPDGSFDAPFGEDWLTLDSDVAARMYRNDMQLLVNFGVGGAVRSIKGSRANSSRRGARAKTQEERVIGLAMDNILQPIEQEIYNVMALSVQGHFEKAYRRWLRNSLVLIDQAEISDEDVVKALWSNPNSPRRDLGELMARIRGIHLSDTIEGPLLSELALIGNVVRHGDGPSARFAYEKYPHMFDPVVEVDGQPAHAPHEELPERLRVTEEKLSLYAQAAFQFWHRVQLAYTGER